MKRYPHIISELFYKPLLITKEKHFAICRVLEAHLARGPETPRIVPRIEDNPDLDLDELEDQAEDRRPDWQTFGPDAIIPVHGILGKHLSALEMISGGCDLDTVSAMIDVAMADAEVRKLIFDFRSPGGAVTGIPELARKIAGITSKETIAFTDSECCSGALWLATQCKHFFATGSASVGSIGVWCAYLDLSRQLANEGQNIQEIVAGQYKTLGAYWKPLTPEEKELVEADVNKIYGEFTDAVLSHREISYDHMEGQIFDGEQAVNIGLCDGLVEALDDLLFDLEEEQD